MLGTTVTDAASGGAATYSVSLSTQSGILAIGSMALGSVTVLGSSIVVTHDGDATATYKICFKRRKMWLT